MEGGNIDLWEYILSFFFLNNLIIIDIASIYWNKLLSFLDNIFFIFDTFSIRLKIVVGKILRKKYCVLWCDYFVEAAKSGQALWNESSAKYNIPLKLL